MARVQLLSVRVVVAVQPSDRAHREQDERRQRQMDDGHPEQRGVRAEKFKLTNHYYCYCKGGVKIHGMPTSRYIEDDINIIMSLGQADETIHKLILYK